MISFERSVIQMVAALAVFLFFSLNALAAAVQVQADGTINSIQGLFIGGNEYVDVEFGATLAPGETTCALGPGCVAGIYVIALNAFLNSGGYSSVNSVSGVGADIYSIRTPVTRLQYMYSGSSWVFSQSGELSADNDIRFSVSAVPIPAAVWLFASALAGLGWLRHRKA